MAKIEVKSEITGTVWQLKAKPGDKVADGDTLLVIESMKMEIPIESPIAGVLRRIDVAEGDSVNEGQILAVIG